MTYQECLWGWISWLDLGWLGLWGLGLCLLWAMRLRMSKRRFRTLFAIGVLIALAGEYLLFEVHYAVVCFELRGNS